MDPSYLKKKKKKERDYGLLKGNRGVNENNYYEQELDT